MATMSKILLIACIVFGINKMYARKKLKKEHNELKVTQYCKYQEDMNMTEIRGQWNIEAELKREESRENEHIFYEEFEEPSGDERLEYKRMAGIPFTDQDFL